MKKIHNGFFVAPVVSTGAEPSLRLAIDRSELPGDVSVVRLESKVSILRENGGPHVTKVKLAVELVEDTITMDLNEVLTLRRRSHGDLLVLRVDLNIVDFKLPGWVADFSTDDPSTGHQTAYLEDNLTSSIRSYYLDTPLATAWLVIKFAD